MWPDVNGPYIQLGAVCGLHISVGYGGGIGIRIHYGILYVNWESKKEISVGRTGHVTATAVSAERCCEGEAIVTAENGA